MTKGLPHAAQHGLQRVLYGNGAVWELICTQKGGFDAQNRQECLAVLGSARVAAK